MSSTATVTAADSRKDEMIGATRQALQALQIQKQSLELEAEAITCELKAPTGDNLTGPPMGIDTPLIDSEGYPRGDIDLYRARHLRGRLAELKTDYKTILKDVERHLHQLALLQQQKKNGLDSSEALKQKEADEYASRMAPKPKPKYDSKTGKWVVRNWDGTVAGAGKEGELRSFDTLGQQQQQEEEQQQLEAAQNQQTVTSSSIAAAAAAIPTTTLSTLPFARVDSVAPLSPAFEAGMRPDDLIVAFGQITLEESSSSSPLMAVGQVVPVVASQNESIAVQVKRRKQEAGRTDNSAAQQWHTSNRQQQPPPPQEMIVTLELKPRPWSGRGLLGCHIVPV